MVLSLKKKKKQRNILIVTQQIVFNSSEVKRKKASNWTREKKEQIPLMHMTHVYISINQIIHLYFGLILATIAS